MSLYSKKSKNFNEKPDEVEIFVKELKRQQAQHKKPKAAIYRSGRAPAWIEEEGSDSDSGADENELVIRKERLDGARLPHGMKRTIRRVQKTTIERKQRKIQQAQIIEDDDDGDASAETPTKAKPQKQEFNIDVSALEVPDAESDSSDDDEVDARRLRARARRAERAETEELEEAPVEEEEAAKPEQEEEDESSEYETDSEDEGGGYASRMLLKPVFVSKKERETIAEKERRKQEEIDLENAKKQRLAERKIESRQMVVDELEREEKMKLKGDGDDEELPDDEDDVDEEEEFKQWKIRELRRIKRDNDEREKWETQETEVERRRQMTDEELKADNLTKKPVFRREKGQYRFLQKYYHPGAFFRDDVDDGYKQMDFSAPTGADRTIDRTLLPQVLQVKKFGLKGRTKYTHLVDQDTSSLKDNPWASEEAMGVANGPRGKRMAGTGAVYRSKKRRVT